MKEVFRLLGDLADAVRSYRRRDHGPHAAENLAGFIGWFAEETARVFLCPAR